MDKKTMRLVYKKARSLFTGAIKEEAEQTIQDRLSSFEPFMLGEVILFYLAMKDEVSTDLLIEEAFRLNKRVVVPYCKEDTTIGLAEITSLDDVVIGAYGIREPKEELRDNVSISEIDTVITPGVAFDKKGNRLGMGKGYYDRFLDAVRPHATYIALAFDCQMTEKIPTDKHDHPVDLIVTQSTIHDPKSEDE